jgi:hypothetical protein
MLQKKNNLSLDQARDALMRSAQNDQHTGDALWTPGYGYGKVNAQAALSRI